MFFISPSLDYLSMFSDIIDRLNLMSVLFIKRFLSQTAIGPRYTGLRMTRQRNIIDNLIVDNMIDA